MRAWHFTEQPLYQAWEQTAGDLKLTIPNSYADSHVVADLFDRYLDEWQACDELGIDIMVNEHHSTATCLSSSCTLPLAALARTTKNVRLLSLGIPIANRPDPVRVAEEIAIIDCYSRGRFEMGFVKGIDYDLFPSNSEPVTQVRRFGEAYRLILKALTTHDGPFSWQGEFYNFRNVNIWPKAFQTPHPPVWMVAVGPGAAPWIAEQKANVGTFLSGRGSKLLFDAYRKRWAELGWGAVPKDKFGYMGIVAVAEDEKTAKQRAYQILGYLRTQERLGDQFKMPAGYLKAEFRAKKLRLEAKIGGPMPRVAKRSDGKEVEISRASVEDLIDAMVVFAGTPDQVVKQIDTYNQYVGGVGNFLLMGQGGDLSHQDTIASLSLFSREVMPRLKDLKVPERA